MKFAIVFFHLGEIREGSYVDICVKLAKERAGADVFLLTDHPEVYPGSTSLSHYWERAAVFDRIYVHKNTCERHFNLRGIQRWFAYLEWWRASKYDSIFCPDSDVMIFSDLAKELAQWRQYDFTLSMGTAAGQSYWNNRKALAAYCNYVENAYVNPAQAETVFRQYDGKGPGGVCDMTFFEHFSNMKKFAVGETSQIIAGATYDHNILMSQGYEYADGRKAITWSNRMPYCQKQGENIMFHTLHMSRNKHRVEEFYLKGSEL